MLLPPFVGAINHRFKIDKRAVDARSAVSKLRDAARFVSTMTTARAAVNVLEAYGYSAKQFGCDVVTDCPALLAIPAIQADRLRRDRTSGPERRGALGKIHG
jgi:hypothetical protein